jgi:hypothetical protein
MSNIGPTFIAVVGGILTLALVAVVVSQKAQTSSVLTAGGSALSNIIAAAVSPVTGGGNQFGNSGQAAAGTTH